MIHVEHLRKSFPARRKAGGVGSALRTLVRPSRERIAAIKDISFSVSPGEIIGYIGPNGAGKSTTIKIMCGILVPDSGSCRISGRIPWRERAAHVAGIGVVFGHRSQLWWDVPVIDSFDLLRRIYRVPERQYSASLDELVAALDISALLGLPARQLSLGQRMRCELAASLLHRPDILFLDEPTIGLDAVSKLAVREFIQRENRERGVTVILTTHDMHDIEALAERVILIGKGEVLYDGGFDALLARGGGGEGRAGVEAAVASLYGEMGIA